MKFSSQEIFLYFFLHIKMDLIFFKYTNLIFFFFFNHKTDLIFYKSKTIFSQFSKNRSDIFSNQKILFSLISTYLNFSLQKTNLFKFLKTYLIFLNQIQFFLQNRSKSLENQTLSGRNGCLTPSHSVT